GMVFSSGVFLYVFLPLFLAVYYSVPRRAKAWVLSLASYVFYGAWRPDFVLLMWVSTLVDFTCGNGIRRDRAAGRDGKRWVWVSCIANLGLLGYFKYANFGVDTLNALLAAAGHDPIPWVEIALPVGISFYTFQTISYTVDVYRGHAEPVRSFGDFACYVAMFPQLVAGPIVRYRAVAEQLHSRTHTLEKFATGVLMFQAGLAKKILLADTIGTVVDATFALEHPSALEAWVASYGYAFQVYFDFSGYSDMAIGLGLMIGFRFPINFNRPFISRSITEFWRRWHISLSSFLRDYLYIPLGGNQKGTFRTYFNLATTMMLCGLWHGANWKFIVFGALHGTMLIAERLSGKRSLYSWLPGPLEIAVTFTLLVMSFPFFRGESVTQAMTMLRAMVGIDAGPGSGVLGELNATHAIAAIIGAIIIWAAPTTQRLAAAPPRWWPILVQLLFVLALIHLHRAETVPFLYFQF
ncbi:MAG: MBOAT family protein, partial [Pseudomonadota bacterium]